MTLPNGADGRLGSFYYRYDQSGIDIGRPPYRHFTRSLFSNSSRIAGKPGAENINPDQLIWQMTNFAGEGQLVLEPDDPVLADRFYRSEGLNFRTAGQFSLNQSTLLQYPQDATGGTTSTIQGNSFTDVTGASTVVNTDDRRLNTINDEVQSTTHTPGATTTQVDFYLYQEGVQLTTIEGNDLIKINGDTSETGTDKILFSEGTTVRSAGLSSLTAGKNYQVNFHCYTNVAPTDRSPRAVFKIINNTNPDNPQHVYQSDPVLISNTATALSHTANFTPVSGKTYQFRVVFEFEPSAQNFRILVDKVTYGINTDPGDQVRVVAYNNTAAAEVSGTAKTVNLTNTATALIVSIAFNAAAATDYKYRVRYTAGSQRPIVDKVITTVRSTSNWTLDCLELGQGGRIWLGGHRSGVDSVTWTYDFTNNNWGTAVEQTITGASNKTIQAMAHTDAYEYFLCSDNIVYQLTTSADNDYTAAMSGSATAVGMCVAQNRLMVLTEDSTNGVSVRLFAVDADVSGGTTAELSNVTVTSAKNTAETTLRQRMVSTPTGGRFFVNYSDVTCKIYECDASATPVVKEIGALDVGSKASAISYVGGLTFVAGQFQAETGQTARSALWVLDQNNIVQRIGYFRRDAPDARAPQWLVPYQNDVWILQGNYVWRYSLVTGGLFLEYELSPKTPANNMALAVMQGHQFALFSDEGVFVTGSVGTYRSAGSSNANQYISSVNDFGMPGVVKVLANMEVLTDTMASGTDCKLEIQTDQSGTWTHIGTFSTGASHRFKISTEEASTTFNNLQVRVTLGSQTGTNTPVVKGIVARAFPAEFEEFFDLALLCRDEDSGSHIDGQQATGADMFRNIRTLWQSNAFTSFLDGYDIAQQEVNGTDYTVRIEQFDYIMDGPGEGIANVRCRVINN